MAKIVYLYSRINQATKIGIDPSLLNKVEPKYDGCNGVWDAVNQKFVAPNTLDMNWLDKMFNDSMRQLDGLCKQAKQIKEARQ